MDIPAGTRFGRWQTVQDFNESITSATRLLCRCECGTEKAVRYANIRTGATQSCGCLKSEVTTARNTTHGTGYESYQYILWRRIKTKCLAPTSKDYQYYGGRGITMHTSWIHDFPAFAAYIDGALGPRPDGGSLDRVDNEGNYEPGNLRWATRSEQALNRRNRWR